MKLSVAIITYNEEDNIGRTLDSVHDLSEEIVIVDSFSTDDTEKISLEYPKVKFYKEDFKGYAKQKQSAIDKCSGEWILQIDGDEEITPKLQEHIRCLVYKNKNHCDVYKICLLSYIGKTLIKYGGWSQSYRVSLFKKDSGHMELLDVHEFWKTDKEIGTIKESINHYTYKSIHHHLSKLDNYTTLQALVKYKKGKRISFLKIIFGPFFAFFKMYIIRLGFLDGL